MAAVFMKTYPGLHHTGGTAATGQCAASKANGALRAGAVAGRRVEGYRAPWAGGGQNWAIRLGSCAARY